MRKATRTSIRLCRAIRAAGFELPGADSDYFILRTRAGHWQRSQGAWSWGLWEIEPRGKNVELGSQWSVRELLSRGFELYDSMGAIALIPNNERGTVPPAPSRS